MELLKEDVEKLLKTGLSSGGDFSEIFFEEKRITSIDIDEEKVRYLSSGRYEGAGLRVIKGRNTGYAYTDDTSFDNLKEIMKKTTIVSKKGEGPQFRNLEDKDKIPPVEGIKRASEIPDEKKLSIIRRADDAARRYDNSITEVKVHYYDFEKNITIVNSDGRFVEENQPFCGIYVYVLTIKNGKKYRGYCTRGGYGGFELMEDVEEIGESAAMMAVNMLEARDAPAGETKAVLAPGEPAILFHESVGHALEADIVQMRGSAFKGLIGERVGSDFVTLVDDPTIPFMSGSIRIDDEGNPAKRTALIENGILTGYMYDRITASFDNAELTGNGRRQDFKFFPIPRMTNTCLLPGEFDPEEIIRETDSGIYIKNVGGGQANTVSGEFTFDVTEGYLIEKGKITAPIKGASLVGKSIDVLKSIDMVGNDFKFGRRGSSCGKGQFALVDSAQPTLRIGKITLGGTEV